MSKRKQEERKPYAFINIYSGICDGGGCPEVNFTKYNKNLKSDGIMTWENDAIRDSLPRAREIIDRVLIGPAFFLNVTGFETYPIVKTEKEALELIRYCEEKIPNSWGSYEPLKKMHGKLFFNRQVIFEGYVEKDQSTLVEILSSSGINPKKRELEISLEYAPELGPLKKLLEEVDIEKAWKETIHFRFWD